jgi:hypothetical protein
MEALDPNHDSDLARAMMDQRTQLLDAD